MYIYQQIIRDKSLEQLHRIGFFNLKDQQRL